MYCEMDHCAFSNVMARNLFSQVVCFVISFCMYKIELVDSDTDVSLNTILILLYSFLLSLQSRAKFSTVKLAIPPVLSKFARSNSHEKTSKTGIESDKMCFSQRETGSN